MSIELVMPSNHLILYRPLLLLPSIFPSIRIFSNESALCGQNIGVSASTSVPPVNTQTWSPLGWTGWISLQSKGLSRVFSNTTVQNHALSFLYSPTLTSIHDHWQSLISFLLKIIYSCLYSVETAVKSSVIFSYSRRLSFTSSKHTQLDSGDYWSSEWV